MSASYKKLWKLLIDRDMKKTDLSNFALTAKTKRSQNGLRGDSQKSLRL